MFSRVDENITFTTQSAVEQPNMDNQRLLSSMSLSSANDIS